MAGGGFYVLLDSATEYAVLAMMSEEMQPCAECMPCIATYMALLSSSGYLAACHGIDSQHRDRHISTQVC